MKIKKIKIQNFKKYKHFELDLNEGVNILVGNNEAGKSTILEAIHLALTGLFNGRLLRNELTEYIFNKEIVKEYLSNSKTINLPSVLIEIYFSDGSYPKFKGNNNSYKEDESGLSFKIAFNKNYKAEYNELLAGDAINSLPIEYYDIEWASFARDSITARTIPLKSALIDSSSNRYQNGSDIYISKIIKEGLEHGEVVSISQAHRKMRDTFINCEPIKAINHKLKSRSALSNKEIELSVELLSKHAWENSLITYLDQIPFHFIGKGEQCIIKTELALDHKKAEQANVILMEEPENHLSHTNLNSLISKIEASNQDKQIIISTHSSFVANKLGLDSLILFNDKKATKLNELSKDTQKFFKKIAGYDTLRLILCDKAILVEGPADELVIQKAYSLQNNDSLPIENNIDVISVGMTFLRFLEIAEKINKEVVVVTDNDGNLDAINKKYHDYLNDKKKPNIKICFDKSSNTGPMTDFNYNTLEPLMLNANSLDKLNLIFDKNYQTNDELLKYMYGNKTECALLIFDSKEKISFPEYIQEAIK